MSVPKYIHEVSTWQKVIKIISLIVAILSLGYWIVHVFIQLPENPFEIFIYPEFFLFIIAISVYTFLYLRVWKERIYNLETDIFETIAYRKKTSIKNIARIKNLKERYVRAILERLIKQNKLFGSIKDGLYISDRTMKPSCSLCNKEIEDHLLMVLCPYCKRPFHKDHIIDYINDVETKCPECNTPLNISDIIS
ncbi:MAG: RING-H2 finger protein [Promethearchaeia archaeon]